MPKKLTHLEIHEISLVDRPANTGARVAVWKRDAAGAGSPPVGTDDAAGDGRHRSKSMPEGKTDTRVADLEAALKKAEAANEALKLDLEKAKAVTALSPAEAEFMKGLPREEQDGFALADAETRKAAIDKAEKAKADDPVAKALAEHKAELAKARADTEELRKQLEAEKFAKRAETELPSLPGTPVEKGAALRQVEKLGDGGKHLLAMLKAGEAAMAMQLKEKGVAGDPEDVNKDEAMAQLDKMAEEAAKADGITKAQAYARVIKTDNGRKLAAAARQ